MNLYQDLDTLRAALDVAESDTAQDADLLRVAEPVSRQIDAYCQIAGRSSVGLDGFGFFPRTETRLLMPDMSNRLLEVRGPKLLTLTSLKVDSAGDDTYATTLVEDTDFVLEPRSGLPKSAVRFLANATTTFRQGSGSSLGVVQVIGDWGEFEETESVGTTNEALDATETGVDLVSGHTLTAGRTIKVESEQMYVSSITGDTATVERGVNGSTAATHDNTKAVTAYRYPRAVEQACLMQSMRLHRRRSTAYANVVANPVLGSVEIFKGLDEDVKELLARYVDWLGDFA